MRQRRESQLSLRLRSQAGELPEEVGRESEKLLRQLLREVVQAELTTEGDEDE